jgi:hypothetical protein
MWCCKSKEPGVDLEFVRGIVETIERYFINMLFL